jgi:hypothetical protein
MITPVGLFEGNRILPAMARPVGPKSPEKHDHLRTAVFLDGQFDTGRANYVSGVNEPGLNSRATSSG